METVTEELSIHVEKDNRLFLVQLFQDDRWIKMAVRYNKSPTIDRYVTA